MSADLAHYYNLADDMITALRGRVPLTDTGFWTEYLWKSHLDRKNSQAYAVSGGEARLVAEAITKLKELRNFQSHVWHDNAVLGFSAELADWVEEKYGGPGVFPVVFSVAWSDECALVAAEGA